MYECGRPVVAKLFVIVFNCDRAHMPYRRHCLGIKVAKDFGIGSENQSGQGLQLCRNVDTYLVLLSQFIKFAAFA
jgi:hypothetical protein